MYTGPTDNALAKGSAHIITHSITGDWHSLLRLHVTHLMKKTEIHADGGSVNFC